MTVPDGDLGDVLRRQLSAAVDAVEPGASGLERIRARTRKRPPQPWLVSVLSGAVSRARNWVWRGHWAWSPPRLRSLALPSSPRAKRAPGTAWLRPVAVLAGVAFIATITLAVPPLRQAIVQVSNNLTGSQPSGGAGTDGNGSPAGNGGGGTLSTGARSTTSAGASGSQSAGSRGPVTTTRCQPTATATATASGSALPLGAVESALPGTQPTACRTPSTSTSQPVSATSATPTPTSMTVTSPTATATGTTTPTATPTSTTTPTTTATPTDTGPASPSTSASDGATGVVGS